MSGFLRFVRMSHSVNSLTNSSNAKAHAHTFFTFASHFAHKSQTNCRNRSARKIHIYKLHSAGDYCLKRHSRFVPRRKRKFLCLWKQRTHKMRPKTSRDIALEENRSACALTVARTGSFSFTWTWSKNSHFIRAFQCSQPITEADLYLDHVLFSRLRTASTPWWTRRKGPFDAGTIFPGMHVCFTNDLILKSRTKTGKSRHNTLVITQKATHEQACTVWKISSCDKFTHSQKQRKSPIHAHTGVMQNYSPTPLGPSCTRQTASQSNSRKHSRYVIGWVSDSSHKHVYWPSSFSEHNSKGHNPNIGENQIWKFSFFPRKY